MNKIWFLLALVVYCGKAWSWGSYLSLHEIIPSIGISQTIGQGFSGEVSLRLTSLTNIKNPAFSIGALYILPNELGGSFFKWPAGWTQGGPLARVFYNRIPFESSWEWQDASVRRTYRVKNVVQSVVGSLGFRIPLSSFYIDLELQRGWYYRTRREPTGQYILKEFGSYFPWNIRIGYNFGSGEEPQASPKN